MYGLFTYILSDFKGFYGKSRVNKPYNGVFLSKYFPYPKTVFPPRNYPRRSIPWGTTVVRQSTSHVFNRFQVRVGDRVDFAGDFFVFGIPQKPRRDSYLKGLYKIVNWFVNLGLNHLPRLLLNCILGGDFILGGRFRIWLIFFQTGWFNQLL